MKLRNIILSTVLLATFSACEDLFEPAKENNRGVEEMLTDPNYADGHIDDFTKLQFKYSIKSDRFQLYSLYIEQYKNLHRLYIDFESTNEYCCLIGLNCRA